MLKVRLPTVDSRNIGTTRRLELAQQSARRPCRSATCLQRPVIMTDPDAISATMLGHHTCSRRYAVKTVHVVKIPTARHTALYPALVGKLLHI